MYLSPAELVVSCCFKKLARLIENSEIFPKKTEGKTVNF